MKVNSFFKKRKTILLLGLLLSFTCIKAQKYASGPQVLSFYSEVDDSEQPYGLYLPENYDEERKYPFIVMLHGAGSNHRLALRRVFGKSNLNGENDVEASRYFPTWKARDFIVATPFARGTMGYQGVAEKDVMDMIKDIKRRFSVDENRTYLTGLSMGGGGTLWIGLSYPDIWAAIAPVCPAPPEEAKFLVSNAINYPVQIFQGRADPVVQPKEVRAWVEAFRSEGVKVEYQEYPGVGHDSWVNAYLDENIFDWFQQFERNPFPDQVKFKTDRYAHNKAYWVTFEEITPGIIASINALFKANNQLVVETDKLNAFSLSLEGHPKYDPENLLKIEIDGKLYSATGTGNMLFTQNGGNWEVGFEQSVNTLKKRKSLEGPMREAISDRHIYIYGTGGNPSKEELERRRNQALKAADWSFYRGEFMGRIMVFPRVLSDQEVRPSDFGSANLILFGDIQTNKVIAKFRDRLPFHLESPQKDVGLAYIFPIGEKYVFINSGRSILEVPDSLIKRDWRSLPPIVNALRSFDDFVLFDNEKVLINGRFNNNWQLNGSEKQQLEASNVIFFP